MLLDIFNFLLLLIFTGESHPKVKLRPAISRVVMNKLYHLFKSTKRIPIFTELLFLL